MPEKTDLSTEMKVAEKDSRLRAGHNENDEDQEEETEHVIHLMRPGNVIVGSWSQFIQQTLLRFQYG